MSTLKLNAQLENGSPLPIVVIDAFGENVPDEPKVDADLYIYYDSTAIINFISDEFLHYEGFSGVEKRGQSSLQLFPKNGYGIETRNDDGSNNNVPLFGWPKENDWVLHGPYSDKSLIRNALAYKLANQVMAYAPRTQFCELIVNGSYEGIYLFTEKIKRDKGRVDISKLRPEDDEGDQLTGGYILKFDKAEMIDYGWSSNYPPFVGQSQETRFYFVEPDAIELTDNQFNYIKNYFDDFESRLMSNEFRDSIEGYRPYIDVDNFVNFILHQELTGNVDSYRLSTYMYKDRDSVDTRFKIGPVWDYNLAFGNADYCGGGKFFGWRWNFNNECRGDFWLNHVWWKKLLSDPFFTEQLKSTWKMNRETIWSDTEVLACIDSLTNQVAPAVNRNFSRWPILGTYIWPNNLVANSHFSEIQNLKDWVLDRMEWMDNNMDAFVTLEELDIPSPGFWLRPNLNNGDFEIKWNRERVTPRSFRLFDTAGRMVYETKEFNPNIFSTSVETQLPSGIYYYMLEANQDVFTGQMSVIN